MQPIRCLRESADRLRRGRRYGWLRMHGVPRGAPLLRSCLVPYERWRHARGREHCRRGEPGSALYGGYALDSVREESSSIVDEPGEC